LSLFPYTTLFRSYIARTPVSVQNGDDAAQKPDQLALLLTHDLVELPVVLGRASGKVAQLLLAGCRQRKAVAALVPGVGDPVDQTFLQQVAQHRRDGRLVAAAGAAQRHRRDAGIVSDDHQHREPPPAKQVLSRVLLESLEGSVI